MRESFQPFRTTAENKYESTIAATKQINRFKKNSEKAIYIDTRFRSNYFIQIAQTLRFICQTSKCYFYETIVVRVS